MNKKKNPTEINSGKSRRQFLKSAGKLAVYTPPAMMVLARPSLANMQHSFPNGQIPNGDHINEN
jgi:hypothetical protein